MRPPAFAFDVIASLREALCADTELQCGFRVCSHTGTILQGRTIQQASSPTIRYLPAMGIEYAWQWDNHIYHIHREQFGENVEYALVKALQRRWPLPVAG